jgi:hypothetical protein
MSEHDNGCEPQIGESTTEIDRLFDNLRKEPADLSDEELNALSVAIVRVVRNEMRAEGWRIF